MNTSQTIFTFFYALYFAVMTTTTGRMHPFDTASMYKANGRAWLRFCVSFFLINLLPLGYFLLVFNRLDGYSGIELKPIPLFIVFVLSLAGFGFYRIYYGMMLLKVKDQYVFYGDKLPKSLAEDLSDRPESHQSVAPHLVPGLLWALICLLLSCCLLR